MNARFWIFINSSPVKLTIAPHETLRHARGGPTDDGYSFTAHEWSWQPDEGAVYERVSTKARDCGGPIEHYNEAIIKSGDFMDHRSEYIDDPEVMFPKYQDYSSWQRDYYAEAAGY
jgi:hypothetical protein